MARSGALSQGYQIIHAVNDSVVGIPVGRHLCLVGTLYFVTCSSYTRETADRSLTIQVEVLVPMIG